VIANAGHLLRIDEDAIERQLPTQRAV